MIAATVAALVVAGCTMEQGEELRRALDCPDVKSCIDVPRGEWRTTITKEGCGPETSNKGKCE